MEKLTHECNSCNGCCTAVESMYHDQEVVGSNMARCRPYLTFFQTFSNVALNKFPLWSYIAHHYYYIQIISTCAGCVEITKTSRAWESVAKALQKRCTMFVKKLGLAQHAFTCCTKFCSWHALHAERLRNFLIKIVLILTVFHMSRRRKVALGRFYF